MVWSKKITVSINEPSHLGTLKLVGAHRHTVTKYIHELLGAGVIYQREIGTVKICYLTSEFAKPSLQKKRLRNDET